MLKSFIAAIAIGFAGVAASASVAEARDYPVTLTYVAPENVQRGEPTITFGEVRNSRDRGLNWLGAIRGGYGNPLKVLVTEQPVHEVVAQAMRDALTARGLATEAGPHRLDLHVVRFDCNQFIPKDAHIIIAITLVDVQSGATLFENTYQVDRVGPGIGGGIFTPVEPLRALANSAMQMAVDQALDDPNFRAALAHPISAPAADVAPAEGATAAPLEQPNAETAPPPSTP